MKTGELLIYEDIGEGFFGGISPRQVAEHLKALGKIDQLNVRINSAGGDVFDGYTIYRQLVRHPARIRVDVDGAACSIASIVAMAAAPGQLHMATNSMMMIHAPWSFTMGTAADMRHKAELLDKIHDQLVTIYVNRCNLPPAELREMMDGETWLDAEEAVSLGLADHVTQDLAIAAHVDRKWLRQIPAALEERQTAAARAARLRLDECMRRKV